MTFGRAFVNGHWFASGVNAVPFFEYRRFVKALYAG